MDRGPGSRPLNEDEMMEILFSKWGAKLGALIVAIFGTYLFCMLILP